MNTTNHPRRGETFEGAPCIRCGSTIRYAAKKHRCVACHDVHNHSPEHDAILKTSWPRKGQEKARHPHMDWGREMAFINHFYFYLWDSEWGGAFWKANAYAPFPVWLWVNGHEWAKRQLDKAGIGYETLA